MRGAEWGGGEQVVRDHGRRFGRSYYQRHDYEGLDAARAGQAIAALRERLPSLAGQRLAGRSVERADEFSYTDPVDGSVSSNQGLRIVMEDGSRLVGRLSGTGTERATIPLYLDAIR